MHLCLPSSFGQDLSNHNEITDTYDDSLFEVLSGISDSGGLYDAFEGTNGNLPVRIGTGIVEHGDVLILTEEEVLYEYLNNPTQFGFQNMQLSKETLSSDSSSYGSFLIGQRVSQTFYRKMELAML